MKRLKVMNVLFKKIDKIIMVFIGTSGGLLLAQFPQFVAQYLQRLGGHVDEARFAARIFHLPELAERANALVQGLHSIQAAPAVLKLPFFLWNAQWQIARETLNNFTPGMTFNQEGLYYLAAGCLLGAIIYGFLKMLVRGGLSLIKLLFKRTKKSKSTKEESKEPTC